MERTICARGSIETFANDIGADNINRFFVRSMDKRVCRGNCNGQIVLRTPQVPVPSSQSSKPKPETVSLKLGKIRIQIKNAENIKVREEEGGVMISVSQ